MPPGAVPAEISTYRSECSMFNQIVGRRVGAAVGAGHSPRCWDSWCFPDSAIPRRGRAAASAPPEITVAQVIHRPLREWQEFSGRLQAVNTVELRPRVSGYIDRVAFEDGARVRKGQLLFQIDPRPFQAEVDRLAAERSRSVSDLSLAQANRARAERLIDAHAISREELRARGRGRIVRAGRLGLDRCLAAGSPPQSRIHRGARADRWSRLARDRDRRQSGDELEPC